MPWGEGPNLPLESTRGWEDGLWARENYKLRTHMLWGCRSGLISPTCAQTNKTIPTNHTGPTIEFTGNKAQLILLQSIRRIQA
ncbi:hypothetical protein CEXT_564621 [Caerostris extrusa]|uniref:Uncharacterized protein n=1 Tax=Caerostris extrusa TaxID=172846 RepID=A0AAV4X9U6_CAEEX|nr:hypothetical protein CEXT_564621 [Caerostris extrusa]